MKIFIHFRIRKIVAIKGKDLKSNMRLRSVVFSPLLFFLIFVDSRSVWKSLSIILYEQSRTQKLHHEQ